MPCRCPQALNKNTVPEFIWKNCLSLLPWEILAYLQLRPAHQLLTLSNPLYSVSPGKHVDRNNFTTWIMATRYDPAWGQAVTIDIKKRAEWLL